ncbi:Chlorophyllase-2, chloroplastic [Tetrabaena socialis]|uniref:Chlorophyllase-2, chloroplastic n=1 Tax=Tetrabaena socialis TaxID=47790 RepID=A0A2J8AJJ3_9CHLO|nr:Chlorophyllase-2, chloroplastic [Tetrabaena socialis]|eukprot:PNH12680.1 Chlorophyllase-2, chloroplastic [Tetrabaena socialis]
MWGIRKSAVIRSAKPARRLSIPQAALGRRHFLIGSALAQLPIAAAKPGGDAASLWTLAFQYTPVVSGDAAAQEWRVTVPVSARLDTSLPTSGHGPPVVIFTAGFLTPSSAYGVYLDALLAAGFLVVSYDTSFETLGALVDDNDSCHLLQDVRRSLQERLGRAAAGPCFLAGHSRGAKVAVLAAAASALGEPEGLPPLAGLCLLDPANGAYEEQDPARYPSALDTLQNQPQLACVPMLVVGAGRGGDCVPRAKNFLGFFEACRGPCTMVTLQDAGHLQFLDAGSNSLQLLCATGRGVRNEDVARAGANLTVAFVGSVRALICSEHPTPVEGCQTSSGATSGSCGSTYLQALASSPLRYTLRVKELRGAA